MADDQTANDECGICLETLTSAVTLPCNHKFCADCLDGWKSKFGSPLLKDDINREKSKSCPLCRKKIPPSKDMLSQLEWHRTVKRDYEGRGETTSKYYLNNLNSIKQLEAEIGDYDGKGLVYDAKQYMELPNYIFDALKTGNNKRVMKWLGSPVDKKKLNARYLSHLNSTLVHLAIHAKNSDLLSILLQYGADVNALDGNGWNGLVNSAKSGFEQAKILLEWGAEISLPRDVVNTVQEERGVTDTDRELFVEIIKGLGDTTKLTNLVSSEFGGRRCEVINLPNHPQLNGKACVVEKYITKKEKYKIIFEGSGNAALVGPNNLKRRDRTPLDCGYYISFENGKMSLVILLQKKSVKHM